MPSTGGRGEGIVCAGGGGEGRVGWEGGNLGFGSGSCGCCGVGLRIFEGMKVLNKE